MSLKKDIDLTRPNSLGKAEKELGKRLIKAHVNKALERAARQSTPVLASRTWDAPPAKPGGTVKGAHASGALVKAWEILPDRPSMSITILNKKIYSPYVEAGVLASKPKIATYRLQLDLFEQWIRARKIIPRKSGMSTRRFARMIIWSINKRTGFRFMPRAVLMRSTERIKQIFQKNLEQELQKALELARNT
ncbi:MAG: hypothetical protein E6Q97_19560 [Desulfurellales bacterium]|nr:MAG: hypothetical protein E6Q97_19560 [Desulfurellales bacterium]